MTSTVIRVVDLIDTTHEGPVASGPGGNDQKVHLMQGSVDGACGPYCLMMALLALGLVDRDDLRKPVSGKKGGLSKLFQLSGKYGPFFHDGTNLGDLTDLLQKSFGKKLGVAVCEGSAGTAVRQFVADQVEANHLVVLGIEYPDGGHWVVAVGLEFSVDDCDNRDLCRFLVLDPGDPAPTVSAWNGVIDARGSGGPYPYTWWTAEDTKVKFTDAIAIWRTK